MMLAGFRCAASDSHHYGINVFADPYVMTGEKTAFSFEEMSALCQEATNIVQEMAAEVLDVVFSLKMVLGEKSV